MDRVEVLSGKVYWGKGGGDGARGETEVFWGYTGLHFIRSLVVSMF